MPRSSAVLVAFTSLLLAGPASSAPVVTNLVLGVSIQGFAPLTAAGAGSIDVIGSTITVPAGLVSLGSAIVVPVTGSTAINSLSITKLSNLSATFSLGGVTAQAPGEVCPGGGPVANGSGGAACNVGGAVGGVMALTGTIFVNIIPTVVVIPVNLNSALIGQGGSTNVPFRIDAAAWSTGTGLVNTGVTVGAATTPAAFPLTLVSPAYVSVLGNPLPIFSYLAVSGGIPLPVPEGSGMLLVALGVAGLLLLRRQARSPTETAPPRGRS